MHTAVVTLSLIVLLIRLLLQYYMCYLCLSDIRCANALRIFKRSQIFKETWLFVSVVHILTTTTKTYPCLNRKMGQASSPYSHHLKFSLLSLLIVMSDERLTCFLLSSTTFFFQITSKMKIFCCHDG
jgi:hypothetical protein